MTPDQQIYALKLGLTAGSDNRGMDNLFPLGRLLASIEKGEVFGDVSDPTVHGLIEGLRIRFADNPQKLNEALASGAGAALAARADVSYEVGAGPEWNDYYLIRWATAGQVADVRELVRRAFHRDGSTAAIGASSSALSLLSAAWSDRQFETLLAETGFKMSRKFADLSDLAKTSVPAPGKPVPVPPAVSAAVGSPVAFSGARSPNVNLPNGQVLTIAEALAFAQEILAKVRFMLIPGESHQWVDNRDDPQRGSFLVLLDPYMAPKGLWAFDAIPGSLLRGEVTQDDDASYSAVAYDNDGVVVEAGQNFATMQEAQFAVAELVRGIARG